MRDDGLPATLTVSIGMAPPRALSSNASSHWRTKTRARVAYRDAAFEATCLALSIPAWKTSGGWQQLAYTPPEWLLPAYEAMERRRTGGWRVLPELLVLDALIVWPAGQQRLDHLNAPHSLKSSVDGMCNAISLNDRLIRLGDIRQQRSRKQDVNDWSFGRTVLMLRRASEDDQDAA